MRILQTGDSGTDVTTLKIWLNKMGFRDDKGKSLIATSNIFDVSTRQALKRFQRKVGLPDTGKFDLATQKALPQYNQTKPVEQPKPVETAIRKDSDGCWTSPKYLKDSNMKQDTSTWCALNVVQQVFYELFGKVITEQTSL